MSNFEKNTNKRRDFLKTAGIFAGTLGAISILKSDVANAAVSFAGGSSNPLRFLDDGTAEFDHGNSKSYVTADGNLVISKQFTASYVYGGGSPGATGILPLPPGMYYPVNNYWGYNYNFVKSLRVNGSGISFTEFNNATVPSNGSGANDGFAWSVFISSAVSPGDIVEATVETREIFASVKGIRAGWKFMPDSMDEQSYQYPVRHDADDPSVVWDPPRPLSPSADDKVYWSWPNTTDYALVFWKLNKYNQAGAETPGHKGSVKLGRRWKPTKAINPTTYQTGITYTDLFGGSSSKSNAARFAVFHKSTGSMSRMGNDLIIRGFNRRAGDATWTHTVKLK